MELAGLDIVVIALVLFVIVTLFAGILFLGQSLGVTVVATAGRWLSTSVLFTAAGSYKPGDPYPRKLPLEELPA